MEHYVFVENPVWQNPYPEFLAQNTQPVQFFGFFGQQSTEINDLERKMKTFETTRNSCKCFLHCSVTLTQSN